MTAARSTVLHERSASARSSGGTRRTLEAVMRSTWDLQRRRGISMLCCHQGSSKSAFCPTTGLSTAPA
ncbi:hypothetical protein DNTS_033857, partial [Danionella cerebrum]